MSSRNASQAYFSHERVPVENSPLNRFGEDMPENSNFVYCGGLALLSVFVEACLDIFVDVAGKDITGSHVAKDFSQIDQGLRIATPGGGGFGRYDIEFVPSQECVYRAIVFDTVETFRPFGGSLRKRSSQVEFFLTVPEMFLTGRYAVVVRVVAKSPTLRITTILTISDAGH